MFSKYAAIACALAALAVCASVRAADSTTNRPFLNDKVSEEMGKVYELLKAVNELPEPKPAGAWDASIEALERAHKLKECVPGSYDDYYVARYLSQAYITRATKGDYPRAIPYLKTIVESPFFDMERDGDFMFLLAQLYLQDDHPNPTAAETTAERYLSTGGRVTIDRLVFLISLKLQRADPGDGKPNKAVIEDALKWVEKGLHLSTKADDRLMLMKAVANIALQNFDQAAESLELLVKLFPKNRQYWPQLYSLYIQLGRDLRAALTLERAQENGFMNTAKENIALVGIYYNLQRFEKAIELLEKGLANGNIEPTEQNYETLAAAYIQSFRELKAMEVYERCSALFPETGKYDMRNSDMYFKMDDLKNARKYAEKAFAKGGLDRPVGVGLFIAFLAYESKDYAGAADYMAKVREIATTERDLDEYNNLRRAVVQALVGEANLAVSEDSKDAKKADRYLKLAEPLLATDAEKRNFEAVRNLVDQILEAEAQAASNRT